MNKDNIYFLYKKNALLERNPNNFDMLVPVYIAIEQYSDTLTIFYKWSKTFWENIAEVYNIEKARGRWQAYVSKGYDRVEDPFPHTRVGNGINEERKIVTIKPPQLASKLASANKMIASAKRNVRRKK